MESISRLLRWDALAAAIAVVAAVIVLVITSSLPFALVIGLVVYWGVINLKARRGMSAGSSLADSAERVVLSMETSEYKIAGMRTLAKQIDRESTREIVVRICDQSDDVIQIMRGDSQKAKAAPLYLEQLIEPAEAMIETYIRLRSRGLVMGNEMLVRTESQDLPMIERASRLFRDQLRSDEGVDGKKLEQILSFNVESSTPIVEPRRDH